MHFYNAWALRILQGSWTDHMAFYGLPLYAYFLAGVYKVCGYSPFVPGFFQAAFEGGTAVILYRLGRRVFSLTSDPTGTDSNPKQELGRGDLVGIMAALGWAFFRSAQAYSIILMPTSLAVFVFWFVVFQVVKRTQLPRQMTLFFLGSLLGVTAMAIATVLFLVPLLLVAIFFRWPSRSSQKLQATILIATGVLFGTSPAWLHNSLVGHDPVFLSAHSGINFWIGNNPDSTGYPKFPPGLRAGQQALLQDSITAAENAEGRPLRRSEVSAYWSTQAVEWIYSHPLDWARLIERKFGNFWNAFQYDDLSVITEFREEHVTLPGIGFGVVAALAIPGMLIASWKVRQSRWVVAAILVQMVSLFPVFVTERYRLAAVPGLLLCASFAAYELWLSVVRARYLIVLVFLALIGASTTLVSMPRRDTALWALDAYNSGLTALEAGRLAAAKLKLDVAYAYCPRSAEVNFAEGNLNLALGRTTAAKDFYAATLQLDPNHERALNNAGVIALEAGDCAVAVKFFRRAVEHSPDSAKLHYLLAKSYLRMGDLPTARSEIEKAIELDGARPEFSSLKREINDQLDHG